MARSTISKTVAAGRTPLRLSASIGIAVSAPLTSAGSTAAMRREPRRTSTASGSEESIFELTQMTATAAIMQRIFGFILSIGRRMWVNAAHAGCSPSTVADDVPG